MFKIPKTRKQFLAYYQPLEQKRNELSLQYEYIENFRARETVFAAHQNRHLNRYIDIVPFDTNRVVLKTEAQFKNDYINASLINVSI